MPKWEEEFEKNLYNGVFGLDVESGYVTQVDPNKIKQFIFNLLAQREQEVREEIIGLVERMDSTNHTPVGGYSNIEWLNKSVLLKSLKDNTK